IRPKCRTQRQRRASTQNPQSSQTKNHRTPTNGHPPTTPSGQNQRRRTRRTAHQGVPRRRRTGPVRQPTNTSPTRRVRRRTHKHRNTTTRRHLGTATRTQQHPTQKETASQPRSNRRGIHRGAIQRGAKPVGTNRAPATRRTDLTTDPNPQRHKKLPTHQSPTPERQLLTRQQRVRIIRNLKENTND